MPENMGLIPRHGGNLFSLVGACMSQEQSLMSISILEEAMQQLDPALFLLVQFDVMQ